MHPMLTALFLLLPAAFQPATAPSSEAPQGVATANTKSVTQADLLRRLIDIDRLYLPPTGERTGMFSSRPAPGSAAERDPAAPRIAEICGHFLRTQPDGWSIMAELNGPGALTRIWSPNPNGRIRFELDGGGLELEFADLFSGRTPPFEEPLCYMSADGSDLCYLPIGFTKSCRVLARDCQSCYEISYVLFPPDTAVQTFARELDEAASAALDEVTTVFNGAATGKRPSAAVRTYTLSSTQELRAGEKLVAESFEGGGIVRALQVAITDRRLPEARYLLHQFILRVYFDGQEQPAVEAPLVDFFGSGLALNRFCSLLGGTDLWTNMPGEATSENLYRITQESHFLYCYLPMPFANVARIEIEAPSNMAKSQHVGLMLYAAIQRQAPPAGAMQLHAKFRSEDPCQGRELRMLETRGPGRIVGCVLSAASPQGAWGDAGGGQVWLEGQKAPRYAGVCVESLVGAVLGESAPTPAVQPLHGMTSGSLFGKCSGFRWFVSDSIEFERGARFAIENGLGAAGRETSYGSLVYWYAGPQAGEPTDSAGRPFFPPLSVRDLTPPPLRIAGAVEIEDHVLGEDAGKALKEQYADGGELSGGRAAIVASAGPVQINLPSPVDREALLGVRMHQLGARYFETVEVIKPNGEPLATIKYDRNSGGIYVLGRVQLKAGDNLFSVLCSKRAIFDCWIVRDPPPEEPSSAPSQP